jgi:hypothetical protein
MASQRDLAKQLLQRAGDDEAAAKAILPVAADDEVVDEPRRLAPDFDRCRLRESGKSGLDLVASALLHI